MADRFQPAVDQLGDAAVEVAHRAVDALERFLAMHQLGGGETQFGKLGTQDEGDGRGFVSTERFELVGLARAGAGSGGRRGRGHPVRRRRGARCRARLRYARRVLAAAGLLAGSGRFRAALPLE